MKNLLIRFYLIYLIGCLDTANAYVVGVGRADCTGPPVEVIFMGYAELGQRGEGLHLRQFSRAYIIDDGTKRVAFVNVDACMISDSVKREVIKRLQLNYGSTYQLDNVAISGTHTHGAPGGFNEYTMYDFPTFGFVRETQFALVSGIYDSIVMAHENMQNATIFVDQTEILDANINRSPTAYLNNPEAERAQYKYDTDKTLTQIRFIGANNQPIGVLNWYAVHGTSMNNSNKLVSSDNTGYASILLEQALDPGSLVGHSKVVASFASTNLGDTSPNTNGPHCQYSGRNCDILTSECPKDEGHCIATGPGVDHFDSCRIIGTKLFNAAMSLIENGAGEEVTGKVKYIHQFVDMPNAKVSYINTTTNERTIVSGCLPAMGYSFAAGTTDGPGLVEFFKQGTTTGNPFWNIVRNFISRPSREDILCQAPKPILLATGKAKFPNPWQPKILPTQLLQIGNVIIAAVPGEFTTMSGRRLRNAIKGDNENIKVILAGLSNSYSSYITTPEEYQSQRYEGASTIFGPYTLPIYLSQYVKLFKALSQSVELDPGPSPPFLSDRLISLTPPVIFDSKPWGKNFGSVLIQPQAEYKRGEQVIAQFVSGNPRNNLQHGESYFTIQQLNDDNWITVANDANWETKFTWKGKLFPPGRNYMTVYWSTSNETKPGQYRIVVTGTSRSLLGKLTDYIGQTQTFSVV